MRLWAATETITFDELAAKGLREPVEVSFSLKPEYVGRLYIEPNSGHFLNFTNLGECGIRQLPALQKTATILTGRLDADPLRHPRFMIRSLIDVGVFTLKDSQWPEDYDRLLAGETSMPCEAVGRLSIGGREWPAREKCFYQVRIHRFLSLCLDDTDPRFGEWVEVTRYGELTSDPDVMGGDVLVAELEIPIDPHPM
ncbi:hypothetical protein EON81_19420 [bacterium]|nr:MAG: hypothetical protein EON81_19420 [bacterium]